MTTPTGPFAALPPELAAHIFTFTPNPATLAPVSHSFHEVASIPFTLSNLDDFPDYLQPILARLVPCSYQQASTVIYDTLKERALAVFPQKLSEEQYALLLEGGRPTPETIGSLNKHDFQSYHTTIQHLEDERELAEFPEDIQKAVSLPCNREEASTAIYNALQANLLQRIGFAWCGLEKHHDIASYHTTLCHLENTALLEAQAYCLHKAGVHPWAIAKNPEEVPILAAKLLEAKAPFTADDLASFSKETQAHIVEHLHTINKDLPCRRKDVAAHLYDLLAYEIQWRMGLCPTNLGLTKSDFASLARADRLIEDYNFCRFCSKLAHMPHFDTPRTATQIQETATAYRAALSSYPLSEVTELDLDAAHLSRLPEAIGLFHNLHKLTLSNNALSSLPESIGHLPKLQSLNVDFTKLHISTR